MFPNVRINCPKPQEDNDTEIPDGDVLVSEVMRWAPAMSLDIGN